MRHGITGPVEISPEQEKLVASTILSIQFHPGDEFTSGAAYGVDTFGVLAAYQADCPLIRLTIPTGAWYNKELESLARNRRWTVLRTKRYPSAPDAYMRRNDLTIANLDTLHAFPPNANEVLRGVGGGTWATIRRARKAGKLILFTPLDGSAPWTEGQLALV